MISQHGVSIALALDIAATAASNKMTLPNTILNVKRRNRRLTSISLKSTNNNVNDQATTNNAAATNYTKPPLATFLETFLQRVIQFILLQKCSSLIITIAASSNGALLKGNIDKFSLSARNCVFRFNLLSLGRCDLSGDDMRLGYVPLLLPLLPMLLWKLRRSLRSLMFSMLLMRQITGTGQQQPSSLPSLLKRTNGLTSAALAGTRSQSGTQEQGMITSNLLLATSFELKDVSFSNGRIILGAEGVMSPNVDKENNGKQQTHWDCQSRM